MIPTRLNLFLKLIDFADMVAGHKMAGGHLVEFRLNRSALLGGVGQGGELTNGDILADTFSGFLAGNAVTGIQLSSGIFMPLLGQISISLAAMHRIDCFAISILDTIPINAAVISGLATCGLTHKEGHDPIFRTTVLYIFFGMLAEIAMCVLFPSLCAA